MVRQEDQRIEGHQVGYKQAREFLEGFGIEPRLSVLTLRQYDMLLTAAYRWFSPEFSQWLADCFDPEGYAVMPGYEDSLSRYRFNIESWEEFQKELVA